MSDDLKARLTQGFHAYEPITLGGVKHDMRCLEAREAIDALERDLKKARKASNRGWNRAERAEARIAELEQKVEGFEQDDKWKMLRMYSDDAKHHARLSYQYMKEAETAERERDHLDESLKLASKALANRDELIRAARRERDEAQCENERLRALLLRHHQHHLHKGTIGLPDGSGGWFEIDNAAEYSDSELYEKTEAALAQHQPTPTEAGGRDSVGNADTHESEHERGRRKGLLEAAADYLFSDEYIHLLERAIAARLATTLNNEHKHTKALELVQAAIRAKAQEGRDDG